jgi:hypothetical protein
MAESASPLALCSAFQLLQQCLGRVQVLHYVLRIVTPKDGSVLHAGTRQSFHVCKVNAAVLQTLQNEVDCLDEHGNRPEHFTLCRVGKDSFLDTIFGKIGVEIYFCFVDELEVGFHDDAWSCLSTVSPLRSFGRGKVRGRSHLSIAVC